MSKYKWETNVDIDLEENRKPGAAFQFTCLTDNYASGEKGDPANERQASAKVLCEAGDPPQWDWVPNLPCTCE